MKNYIMVEKYALKGPDKVSLLALKVFRLVASQLCERVCVFSLD